MVVHSLNIGRQIPGFDFKTSLVHIEFQACQNCTVRTCPPTKNNNNTPPKPHFKKKTNTSEHVGQGPYTLLMGT